MNRALLLARTYRALGLRNLARVGVYRLGLRTGVHPVLRVRPVAAGTGPFFSGIASAPAPAMRNRAWDANLRLYGWHVLKAKLPIPDFLANPTTDRRWRTSDQLWFRIPDFDAEDGDVKMVWELSRFEWAVAFAQAARQGQAGALDRLNEWLARWCEQNPGYTGPNWKCGQEGSIRILHLAAASLLLDPAAPTTPGLLDMIEAHLRRIAPTLSYALGQDNNHGTTEAAALFVGGSWLANAGRASGRTFARAGRRWLEERAARLFLPDGTFSQYSVNYHRLALDTFSLAEVWRRHLALSAFSPGLVARLRAATDWLHAMTDPQTGDAPNLGHNDGARILALTDTPYRDYRPSVARGKALFAGERVYDAPEVAADLAWLGIEQGARPSAPLASRVFPDGGIAVLRRGRAMALLRYPKFRFRPAHDDIMHVDLWVDGRPVLPDGGSYSYNAGDDWLRYFMGADSHNSVTFDDRGHMPKLGRFLFGAWPSAAVETPLKEDDDHSRIAVRYRDWCGASHRRELILSADGLHVIDDCGGSAHRATLRWRLGGGTAWTRTAEALESGGIRLVVTASGAMTERLVDGYQSLHYDEKTPLQVLEADMALPGRFETAVTW